MPVTDLDRMVLYRRKTDRGLVPLDSPTTALGANSTSIATGVAIGFTFTFDGADYTTCALSSRGFLRLAGTVTSSTNSNLFAASTNVVLAPWWDALETAVTVGYIKHETQGDAPFRTFVAEWYCNLDSSYDGTNYARAKFQVILHETWNLIEFRYGTRETGGSPSNTGSASVGVKGDTSVTATNYRDLATPSGTPVDNLTLGGATSTTTTTLRHYTATEWPGDATNGWALVIEPAWPMTGSYIDISDDELAGFVGPWTLRKIANNVNWLYCNYRPPVVNVSPWYPTSATIADPKHAVPVVLSADGLTYQVHVESYSADGTSTATVDVDNAADPQPATGGDWSSIATPTTPASVGTQSWAAFDITPNPARDFLRFAVTDADHKIMSIMVAPKKLTDFDPTASLASGFVWMSVAQIVQDYAAVHPEFFNRAWRNVARVVLDREQVLWSLSAGVGADYDLGTSPAVRTLGVAPCALRGWQGQDVTVKILAQQDSNGGRLVVGQRGGDSVVFDDIGDIDTEFHYDEDTMTLVGDEPVLYAQLDPADTAQVHYVGVHWVPDFVDEDYIRGTTPAPRLEYLFALVERIRRACLYGYASTGIATMLRRGASSEWRCAWMVPPATKAMRAKVARHTTQASKGSPQDTSIYGTSSGAGAADEIVIESPHAEGRDTYPPDSGTVAIASGSLRFDASPASAGDRLLESPTAGTVTGPTREMVKVTYGIGMTLVPLPDDPALA